MSVGYNVLYKQITFEGITYTENIKQLKKKYSIIERGSSIIFGERQIDYLRTDLVPLKPYYLPLFAESESLGDFNKRISKSNSIFFNIPKICKKPYQTLSGDRDLNCISSNKKIHFFDNQIMNYIKSNKNLGLHRISEIK